MSESIEPTAWSLFFHPRRWKETVMEYMEDNSRQEEELASLRQTLEERDQLIDTLRHELASVSTEKGDLARKISEMETAVESVTMELLKTRHSLDESRRVEEQMKEFDGFIDKVEQMKENYERRISQLKDNLRECRRAMRMINGDDSDELAIDMGKVEAPGHSRDGVALPPPSAKKPAVTPDKESDWLSDLKI